eukprot:3544285-Pleurochrysis_carterae.AAC.1
MHVDVALAARDQRHLAQNLQRRREQGAGASPPSSIRCGRQRKSALQEANKAQIVPPKLSAAIGT